MKVLLTGGAGYIGSHTAKYLHGLGIKVVVYDNLSRGKRSACKWGMFDQGDILDKRRLDAVLSFHQPNAVIHFAGLAYVAESVADPAAYYQANVGGTLNLLDAMRVNGIKNLVFSSSCTTYRPSPCPFIEGDPQHPKSPYGRSKLMVERILRDYGRAYGIEAHVLRYFNAAGADPECEIGEDHDPETHLIPLAIETAMGRRPLLTVNGNQHPTHDGTCIRDYVHVWDLAQAHYLAAKMLLDGCIGDEYNLGSGTGHSVKNVISLIEEKAGAKIPVEYGPARRGDAHTLIANTEKARTQLGWSPQFSDLPTIIDTAWNWHAKKAS